MRKLRLVALASLLFCTFGFARRVDAPPDLILFNGKIFTANSRQPYVEALAIRGDRIVATGSAER